MKAAFVFALVAALALIPASATASGNRPYGDQWDFEFTYEDPTGGPTAIPDNALSWYYLDLTLAPGNPADPIVYMELEIAGLTHDYPEDLDVSLLDPFSNGIVVMEDAGDGMAVAGIDLMFSDFGKEDPLPHGVGPLLTGPGTIYLPDGPGEFGDYAGGPVGTASWIVVITDDSPGDTGSFGSVTLRGIVPEPMTLSLLALGALVMLRRKAH